MDYWEDLPLYIEAGQVAVVVGAGAVTVEQESGQLPLVDVLARTLATELRTKPRADGRAPTLNEVFTSNEQLRAQRSTLYARLKKAHDRLAPPIPETLRKLARIRQLRVFVSTTFDDLLARAIDEERFGGKAVTRRVTFAPNSVQDLTAEDLESDRPVVFQLLGKISAMPDYAVTDEDVLEFFHSLQAQAGRLSNLFDFLRTQHLLVVGTGFRGWLARFFLRIAKSERIWRAREKIEIFTHDIVREDPELAEFLTSFSLETRIFEGTPSEFVEQLSKICGAYFGHGAPDARLEEAEPSVPTARSRSVEAARRSDVVFFISYAREDIAAARRLKTAIEQRGGVAWLDERNIEIGDDYAEKIRRDIMRSDFFIPVISENTERRTGFFRREWGWALGRLAEFTGLDRPFLMPVVIDDISFERSQVPPEYKRYHAMTCPGGQVSPAFGDTVTRLIRHLRASDSP